MTASNAPSRPAIVSNAVRLLYASLAIGVVRAFLEFNTMVADAPIGLVLVISAITFGLLLFLIYKIAAGRNWARIVFLVLFVVGVPMSVIPLVHSLAQTPVSGLIGLVQLVVQVIALVMLFQSPSNAWFRSVKQARQAAPGS